MRSIALAFALMTTLSSTGFATPTTWYMVQYEDHGSRHRQVVKEKSRPLAEAPQRGVIESTKPQYVLEHQPLGKERLVTLEGADREAIARILTERGVEAMLPVNEAEELSDEVVTLVDNGPSANRIDLVFMGDGYTQGERAKFFTDIQRIVDDMFEGQTFASYLPLFNVHAVFRASAESGIGVRGQPKDTAYKLAREGDTLRAIFMHDQAGARSSCAAAPDCDYPVVIGNDPFYGGLGGEFAISTSSETSGTVVLRHELGHTIGEVGEEYDGGGYFGANTSPSVSDLKWRHWSTAAESGEEVAAEPTQAKFLDWPWFNLSRGSYSISWTSDGQQARSGIWYSVSGLPQSTDLSITLDGQALPFVARGDQDRFFSEIETETGFSAGRHELKFTENVHDANNWVSNLKVFEYGRGYHYDNNFIGAYPTFDSPERIAGYRPTHEACLMRNMGSVNFCNVCKENLWLKLLATVKLIDDVQVERGVEGVSVRLATQAVPELKITWLRNGQEVPALGNHTEWNLPTRDATGSWQVKVELQTPEVRQDTANKLKDQRTVTI